MLPGGSLRGKGPVTPVPRAGVLPNAALRGEAERSEDRGLPTASAPPCEGRETLSAGSRAWVLKLRCVTLNKTRKTVVIGCWVGAKP